MCTRVWRTEFVCKTFKNLTTANVLKKFGKKKKEIKEKTGEWNEMCNNCFHFSVAIRVK